MKTFLFDADGVCQGIYSGRGYKIEGAPHVVEAEIDVQMTHEVFLDTERMKIMRAAESKLDIPQVWDINKSLSITLPAGVVAIVNGERFRGSFTLLREHACLVTIDLRGRQYGSYEISFRGYAQHRAAEYPSIEDQLDMIYHEGLEPWKAKLKKIKEKYPK